MKSSIKICFTFISGVLAASLIWTFFVLLLPVGNVDGRIICKYELSQRLNQNASSAIKNIGKDIAFEKAMKELHISVLDEIVDREYDIVIEKYGGPEEVEKIMMDMQGNSETFKKSIRQGILQQKAIEHFAQTITVPENEMDADSYRMEKGAEKYREYMDKQENEVVIRIY